MRAPAVTLLVLVACGSDPPAPVIAPTPPPVTPPSPDAYVAVELPRSFEPLAAPTPRQMVHALPSVQPTKLAITDDGRAAVTADLSGTARVWPTLDGKREPVVVALAAPSALAMTRSEDGFTIAALDAAGQLELIATKETGEVVQRLGIETPQPIASIHGVKGGFLALADDRTLAFVGENGVISARLVAEPEVHVASIAVRREHAIAMIESGGNVRARRIELSPLRWGDTSPALAIAADAVALTPDGERVAGVTRNRLRIVELATGKSIGRSFDHDLRGLQLRPIGFVDHHSLAFSDLHEGVFWWDADGTVRTDPAGHRGVPIAIGDRGMVTASGGALMIARPDRLNEYVGYRMAGPFGLHAVGTRFLATDSVSLVKLDERFRTVKTYELPKVTERGWFDVRVIDARHVVASTYDNGYAVYVIDLVDNEVKLVAKHAHMFDYHPATKRLAYRTVNTIEIVEFDPASGTFGTPTVIGLEHRAHVYLTLLDPKLANGNVAVLVNVTDANRAKVTVIGKLHPVGLTLPYDVASERTVDLDDEWWRRVGDYAKLVDHALLPGPWVRSPDGALAVTARDHRITLRDASGERWTVPSHGASNVLWTPAGKLVVYGTGIAELDLASGAIVERQCGWRFGRWSEPLEGFGAANLCEAP